MREELLSTYNFNHLLFPARLKRDTPLRPIILANFSEEGSVGVSIPRSVQDQYQSVKFSRLCWPMRGVVEKFLNGEIRTGSTLGNLTTNQKEQATQNFRARIQNGFSKPATRKTRECNQDRLSEIPVYHCSTRVNHNIGPKTLEVISVFVGRVGTTEDCLQFSTSRGSSTGQYFNNYLENSLPLPSVKVLEHLQEIS